jgi:hypothetical protein
LVAGAKASAAGIGGICPAEGVSTCNFLFSLDRIEINGFSCAFVHSLPLKLMSILQLLLLEKCSISHIYLEQIELKCVVDIAHQLLLQHLFFETARSTSFV